MAASKMALGMMTLFRTTLDIKKRNIITKSRMPLGIIAFCRMLHGIKTITRMILVIMEVNIMG
jgi:hypothetical protein